MKILVVDHETSARERLRQLLAETEGDHELAGEACNGLEAIERCRSQPIDLVLLDLQIPGMDGLQTAARLARLERPPRVVLMTPEPARGGELLAPPAVLERLDKPVEGERLEAVLRRSQHLAWGRQAANRPIWPGENGGRRTEISAPYRGSVVRVAVRDVVYLQAEHKYVTVYHANGQLLVDESLRSFEREFPDLFLRIHRNALVARNRLEGLEKQTDGSTVARLHGRPERLTVSRRHLAQIRRWLRAAS
ncbi:LytR/AlgR family response regulator transcription factor [Marichromatium bheemlicum]|uniref:Response regulator transcription factor n=1 Tax=Marichromatium bheemlicum TaxID=365339 RepID=A0ABX1I6E6_9GAMM|nr:LytTR family DNA-binding domain-containing protein [Marichromatium bheemlicum]NKN32853.1 response regulator transcription factor [Marichromatium bheemlicum]